MTNIYRTEKEGDFIYQNEKPFPNAIKNYNTASDIVGASFLQVEKYQSKIDSAWLSSSKRIKVAEGENKKFADYIGCTTRMFKVLDMKDFYIRLSEGVEIGDCFIVESEYKGNGRSGKAFASFVSPSQEKNASIDNKIDQHVTDSFAKQVHSFFDKNNLWGDFHAHLEIKQEKNDEDFWRKEHEAFVTAMKIDNNKSIYEHLQNAFQWFKEQNIKKNEPLAIKTAEQVLHEKRKQHCGYITYWQQNWIISAMEEYANQFKTK